MSWVSTALQVAGAAQQGISARGADRTNAAIAGNEANMSVNMGAAQEGIQRRANREALGRQAAAFGAAGVGYGGSSAVALNQSAVNQELDALNTRYKGTLTGYGYNVKAGLDNEAAGAAGTSGALLAGQALLKGMGSNYSFAPSAGPSGSQ